MVRRPDRGRPLNLTLRILLALVAGLAIGALLAAFYPATLDGVKPIATTVGGLWLGALRMTIVPLIFGMLVTGLAGTADAGRLAAKLLGLFAVLLPASALLSLFGMPALLRLFPIPEAAAAALRSSLGGGEATPPNPPISDWLLSFVPINPVGAAANGQMVQLVVFALVFGLAITRIDAGLRQRLVELLEAIVQTMLMIVHWVLLAAPVGVLALSLNVGATAGIGAAGALAHYLALVMLILVASILAMYPLISVLARIGPWHFARSVVAVQLLAFSTQSSIACLPAMAETALNRLGVPERIAGVVLPLSVSLFRLTSPAANFAVAIYCASLFQVHLGPLALIAGALVASTVTLAGAGLPSQVTYFTTIGPICLAMGVPLQALPLLIAVESLPDLLRTVGNVTADIGMTAIAARLEGSGKVVPP
jgi:Na+/H+-dicarboxylate symporter